MRLPARQRQVALGDDLVALSGVLDMPKGTRFVFPEAPLQLPPEYMGGRAWWWIDLEARMRRRARASAPSMPHLPQTPRLWPLLWPLFVELARRGYTQADLEKIASRNIIRALRQAEQTAASLKGVAPSEARIGK